MKKYLRPFPPFKYFKNPTLLMFTFCLLISIPISLCYHKNMFVVLFVIFGPIAATILLSAIYFPLPTFFTGIRIDDEQLEVIDFLPKVFFIFQNNKIAFEDIQYLYFVNKEIKNRKDVPCKITQVNIKRFNKFKKYPWDRFCNSSDIFKTLVISDGIGAHKIYIRYFTYYKQQEVENLINHIFSINPCVEIDPIIKMKFKIPAIHGEGENDT